MAASRGAAGGLLRWWTVLHLGDPVQHRTVAAAAACWRAHWRAAQGQVSHACQGVSAATPEAPLAALAGDLAGLGRAVRADPWVAEWLTSVQVVQAAQAAEGRHHVLGPVQGMVWAALSCPVAPMQLAAAVAELLHSTSCKTHQHMFLRSQPGTTLSIYLKTRAQYAHLRRGRPIA